MFTLKFAPLVFGWKPTSCIRQRECCANDKDFCFQYGFIVVAHQEWPVRISLVVNSFFQVPKLLASCTQLHTIYLSRGVWKQGSCFFSEAETGVDSSASRTMHELLPGNLVIPGMSKKVTHTH